MPTPADVRADPALFQHLVRSEATQHSTAERFERGSQPRGRTALNLAGADTIPTTVDAEKRTAATAGTPRDGACVD